ncbi:hypothetical protein BHE74_00020774, partial [Ensete ventricosum]
HHLVSLIIMTADQLHLQLLHLMGGICKLDNFEAQNAINDLSGKLLFNNFVVTLSINQMP